ncbi:hypothetical protein MRX96_008992 [Rhipicephalus microplus]
MKRPLFCRATVSSTFKGVLKFWMARERFCTTKGCEEHKRRIEGQLDKSVDPCDDLGTHVCGGWASRKEFLLSRSQMTDMHLAWLYKLSTTLEAGVARLPVGMKVDEMFKSCMTPGKPKRFTASSATI